MTRTLFAQFGRFLLVGGLATVVQYVVLVLLVGGAGLEPVLSSTAGFILGALVNYDLNYRFTFRSQVSYLPGLGRFSLVATSGLALNAIVMAVGTKSLGLHYVLAQVLATVVVLFWNFYAHRRWTY